MTANVSIITSLEKDVIKVPNAALRFKWQPAEGSPERGSAGATGMAGMAGGGRPQAGRAESGAKTQGVWILAGQKPRRALLTLGINDGNETAVLSGDLKEGDAVIIETTGQAKKSTAPTGGPGLFR